MLAANGEQIRLYHAIGLDILARQRDQGWGSRVIDRLSADLRAEFPDMKGLSTANLKYMRFFAQECPDLRIGQRTAEQLPWFHIVTYGVPHCVQGLKMLYRGKDEARGQFRYGCPLFDRKAGTVTCPNQGRCCPNPGTTGRQFRVDRDLTPQVDWDNPQHSEDTKVRYNGRTSVERTIARTKRSLPFKRHYGRGRRALQGHLDKSVLAFHVFLHAAHAEGLAKHGRKILTWHKRPDDDENAVAA